MAKPIVLYDIPSRIQGKSWSPAVWKTRYALGLKGVPFETIWVEYPDIASVSQEKGFQPTTTGIFSYTLPAIFDPNTSTALADSALIAEYLDKTYPDLGPTFFPPGSHVLQNAFIDLFKEKLLQARLFSSPAAVLILNPRSQEYFRRTREISFGKPLEEVEPKGEEAEALWAKIQKAFDEVNGWLEKGRNDGPFFLGQEPAFVDIFLVSHLQHFKKIWGEEHEYWKGIASWNDGRWAKLVKDFEKYEVYS